MTYIVGAVLIALLLLLVLAVVVIVALLRRLDSGNATYKQATDEAMKHALAMQKQAPKQMEAMLASLAATTQQIHGTIRDTVAAVMAPPMPQVIDGPQGTQQYPMPTMAGDGDAPDWDHTDKLVPRVAAGVTINGPVAVVGYEHELDPDFDPNNSFGIPGLTDPA